MTDRPLHEIVNDIAATTVKIGEINLGKYFLYVEFAPGVIGPDLFQDVGDHLSWLKTRPLTDLLFEMNYLADPRPIGAFALDIDGEQFKAAFNYDVELLEGTEERMLAAVKARFGDKPIVYPPPRSMQERFAAGEFG
ncbi:hypothetical protein [Sphingomonas bacterium]|uniref:hypothetical protein n=1 Tax=Sphingomonas bacterium TaxID=1895847 RepID=UPI001575DC05|nr:hypothetical protein [Sphingomonas bacterium]